MPSFPTPDRARLKVRNPAGDVRVETADTAETTVELVPLDRSDATREAIENARVEARGDEIVVELEGRSWSISIGGWGIGGSPKVGVRVRCPHGSDLACDTAAADVTVDGRLGELRLRTASGDSRVDHVGGPLSAKTASGNLQVGRVDGRAEVHTVSGDVELGELRDGLDVNSVSGDVVVGEVAGDLSAGSVSGDQTVRAAGPGHIALKSVSGDVHVGIRRGLRVKLDVSSLSGSIESELEPGEAPSGGGGDAELRVRTTSGDVRIARAAAVEA